MFFNLFYTPNEHPPLVAVGRVVGPQLVADLGLYVTKGRGAGKLGEGAPGKCEGSQHQLWESTWLFPLPLQRIMFIHLESRNCC